MHNTLVARPFPKLTTLSELFSLLDYAMRYLVARGPGANGVYCQCDRPCLTDQNCKDAHPPKDGCDNWVCNLTSRRCENDRKTCVTDAACEQCNLTSCTPIPLVCPHNKCQDPAPYVNTVSTIQQISFGLSGLICFIHSKSKNLECCHEAFATVGNPCIGFGAATPKTSNGHEKSRYFVAKS